jgi:hypothetical protein
MKSKTIKKEDPIMGSEVNKKACCQVTIIKLVLKKKKCFIFSLKFSLVVVVVVVVVIKTRGASRLTTSHYKQYGTHICHQRHKKYCC